MMKVISSKIMFAMQKEEAKLKTPDITLKDVGISPTSTEHEQWPHRKLRMHSLVYKPFVNQTCILSFPCRFSSSWKRLPIKCKIPTAHIQPNYSGSLSQPIKHPGMITKYV